MKLWLRLDADSPRDPRMGQLGQRIGLPPQYAQQLAYGMVVSVWAAMAEHAPHGDLSAIADSTIERWAGWHPQPRKPAGTFAREFLKLFCDETGKDPYFAEQQGALVIRMEKDRRRKGGGSGESPPPDEGNSADFPRNERGKSNDNTERNGTKRTATVELDLKFEEFWAEYPRRAGTNPKRAAREQWVKRLREGATPEEMIAGAQRYRSLMERTGKIGTEFVMQAVRFLGKDRHFEDEHLSPELAETAAGRDGGGMRYTPPVEW